MESRTDNLSVLCADVTRAGLLTCRFDAQEVVQALRHGESCIRLSVENHGGRLHSRPGQRLLAYFSDNVDALQAAIDMQRHAASQPPCAGVSLVVRVGLCAGHQLREEHYFPDDNRNPAVRLSADAAPGHILLSVPRRLLHFPWEQLSAGRIADISLCCGKRNLNVFSVPWQERDPASLCQALAQYATSGTALNLHYRGVSLHVDSRRPRLTIGRTDTCDLVIRDPRCSRQHGFIEKRADRFVFVDTSHNGTFVSTDNGGESHTHHREIELTGGGQLNLGAPTAETGPETLLFQIVRHGH